MGQLENQKMSSYTKHVRIFYSFEHPNQPTSSQDKINRDVKNLLIPLASHICMFGDSNRDIHLMVLSIKKTMLLGLEIKLN